ncbi:uncharacterized protein LOC125317611 [Corvus hawaiiensis]|uniref:uncharacterized protein LOC125317611 n=1 Tax=Corvus hawaiiensis TaxID=134902 RepID=UPI0020194E9D|nr:uncharacterized protein LOC125317611 [Corvus hawaiiensis]
MLLTREMLLARERAPCVHNPGAKGLLSPSSHQQEGRKAPWIQLHRGHLVVSLHGELFQPPLMKLKCDFEEKKRSCSFPGHISYLSVSSSPTGTPKSLPIPLRGSSRVGLLSFQLGSIHSGSFSSGAAQDQIILGSFYPQTCDACSSRLRIKAKSLRLTNRAPRASFEQSLVIPCCPFLPGSAVFFVPDNTQNAPSLKPGWILAGAIPAPQTL